MYQFYFLSDNSSLNPLDSIMNPFIYTKFLFNKQLALSNMIAFGNICNSSLATEASTSVHRTLSKNLGNNDFFLANESKKISPIDFIAYAFLKEELLLIPDAECVQNLKTKEEFKNLINFVNRFEMLIKDNKIENIYNLEYPEEEIDKICARHQKRGGQTSSMYKKLQTSYHEQAEEDKTVKIRKISLALFAVLGFAFLKSIKNE